MKNKLIEKLDDDLNKILRQIIHKSKKNIKENGHCSPAVFFVTEDSVVASHIPLDVIPKEACYHMISTVAKDLGAFMTILVMEAWILDDLSPQEFESYSKSGEPVSSHPRKKEVLAYSIFTPSKGWVGTIKIDSKNKKILESAPIFVEQTEEHSGLLIDSLKNRAVVH